MDDWTIDLMLGDCLEMLKELPDSSEGPDHGRQRLLTQPLARGAAGGARCCGLT
jgi:hypothetical protein